MTQKDINNLVEFLLKERFSKPLEMLEKRIEDLQESLRKIRHNTLALQHDRIDLAWRD